MKLNHKGYGAQWNVIIIYLSHSKNAEITSLDGDSNLEQLAKRLDEIGSGTSEEYYSEQQIRALVKKIRDQATLVIVGRVISFHDAGSVTAQSFVIRRRLNLEVESVKRGHYPDKTINIGFSAGSNMWPSYFYLPK